MITMIGLLTEYQVGQFHKMAEEFLKPKNQLEVTSPQSCPCCGSNDAAFIKKGFAGRKKRYHCKACGKKFTYGPVSSLHIPIRTKANRLRSLRIPFLWKPLTGVQRILEFSIPLHFSCDRSSSLSLRKL